MSIELMKSTPAQIRDRFDGDVERFSNLETGQSATIDSPLILELIAQTAAAVTPNADAVLDVGCGAGNYTLKLLQYLPNLDCSLIDLSRPMLDRAAERVGAATAGKVITHQGDIRELQLADDSYDILLAAMVLHHLRTDAEWEAVFRTFHRVLRPGGSVWIADMVEQTHPAAQGIAWKRYGDYLAGFKGEAYRDHVFSYIEQEDTAKPLMFQIDLLRTVGFTDVDVLHKNSVFTAFGGVKAARPQ